MIFISRPKPIFTLCYETVHGGMLKINKQEHLGSSCIWPCFCLIWPQLSVHESCKSCSGHISEIGECNHPCSVFTKQCRPHRNGLRWVTGGLGYSHLHRQLWPLLEHRNTNTTEWEWPVLKQKWPALQCSTQATLACVSKKFSWTLLN